MKCERTPVQARLSSILAQNPCDPALDAASLLLKVLDLSLKKSFSSVLGLLYRTAGTRWNRVIAFLCMGSG